MSNLVIILLITIFFFCIVFFIEFFLSISSLNVCLINNFVSLFFEVCLERVHHSLMVWVINLKDYLKLTSVFFLNIFCQCFFAFLFIGSSQFHVECHMFDLLTRVGCRVCSRFFVIFFNLYF